MQLEDRNWCFGCGNNNPIGLHLKFTEIPKGVRTIFVPEPKHEGYKDITHGGIISALLDEALAWACKRYKKIITVSLEIKFCRPIRTGKPVFIEAKITKNSKRYIYGIAKALTPDGKLLAQAKGKLAILA